MKTFLTLGCSVLALAAVSITAASAAETKITTKLSAAEEVPPVDSKGMGSADLTYDDATKMLTWKVEFSDLTGPATAAHFHGPAKDGENAGVAIPIAGTESPMEGSATLNDEQAKQLMDGLMYVNVHTAANPKGEIRGQVKPGM